jgi:hypothetical protein
MKKPRPIKINAPPAFREFLYRQKAKNPEKTLIQIMEDIARRNKKDEPFFPKM